MQDQKITLKADLSDVGLILFFTLSLCRLEAINRPVPVQITILHYKRWEGD